MDFARLRKPSDIRLFILYLLKHIEYPLDFNTICDVATVDGVVDVFDFSEQFSYLLELGNITEIKKDDIDEYVISEQGMHICDSLESTLLHSLRDYCLKRALTLLDFKKRGADITVDSFSKDGKDYVSIRVYEKGNSLIDLTIKAEDEDMKNRMIENFNERPDTVYKGIISLMSGDINYLLD